MATEKQTVELERVVTLVESHLKEEGLTPDDVKVEVWMGPLDAKGEIVADGLDPRNYMEFIGEYVEPDSYLKSPYYKPLGYPDGMYRVGPLARCNVVHATGTPEADDLQAILQSLGFTNSTELGLGGLGGLLLCGFHGAR